MDKTHRCKEAVTSPKLLETGQTPLHGRSAMNETQCYKAGCEQPSAAWTQATSPCMVCNSLRQVQIKACRKQPEAVC